MIRAKIRQPLYYHLLLLMQEFILEIQPDLVFGRGIHEEFQISEHLAGS